ncbi:MAG: heavy-metal-associated domain-containing protein [Chloroflexi bacterium]|nr:heavy-metal-associated domain-containing protein [Chloroflexota bacterium]
MSTRQLSFSIQGMFCARCAVELERALAQRDGVIGASVNYASERATVLYEPARVNPSGLVAVVKEQGLTTPLEQELNMQANQSLRFGAHQRWLLPTLVGIGGGATLVLLYLAILSLAQSPSHALEQLSQDRFWVGLVALGLGIQIGLYTYLRLIIHAMQLAGATALTGAGTGTSTVGMIACCAHHLADLAPLVTLTGATGLSGAVAFLAAYKIPFIVFGLAVNALGIAMSVRTIRRERAHLKMMERSAAPNTSAVTSAAATTAPTCH